MEQRYSPEPLDLGVLSLKVHKKPSMGESAPDFSFTTLDGRTLNLSDMRGKVVLLDFWAVWCGPCRGETPHLKAVYDKFGKDDRFVMVGLSLDPNLDAPRQYAKDNNLQWVQGFLGEWSKTKVPESFGVRGIPAIFLIGPDGKILAQGLRGQAIAVAVEQALRSLPAAK